MVDMAYMPEVLSYHSVMFPKLLFNVLSLEVIGIFLFGWINIFSFPCIFPNYNLEILRSFFHHVNIFIVDFEGRIIAEAKTYLLLYTLGNYKSLSVGSMFILHLLLPLLPVDYHCGL